VISLNTVIVGSGAAGLNCAVQLDRLGCKDLAIITERLGGGTSNNTGSDKQTYYKLSVTGGADSPRDMAASLFDGGAMHGDLALVEATLSAQSFYHLVSLGVPFPHDRYGGFVGYKTDHDPRQRATSAGPKTSMLMFRSLLAEVERRGLPDPVDRWRKLRDAVHDEICARGFDAKLGAFTQAYGSGKLDASLLMMPLVGFLPASDPRVAGTVRAIERDLLHDGLVLRYLTEHQGVDGLPPGEGAFLPCSFWLADVYVLHGRHQDAERLYEHLLSLRNDVGLLAEEYDPRARRQLGNFPQAFSHVGLVNTAWNLARTPESPALHRRGGRG
jgi:hypothetical protein